MPRIRELESQVASPISVDIRASPQASGTAPVTAGEDLIALGSGLQKFAVELGGLYAKYERAKIVSDLSKAENEAERELTARISALEDGELVDGEFVPPVPAQDRLKAYDEYRDKVKKRQIEKLGNDIAGQAFESRFSELSARGRLKVQKGAVDSFKKEIRASTQDVLSEDAHNYVNGDELKKPLIQQRAIERIQQSVEDGIFSPEEGVVLARKFNKDIGGASVRKLIRQDPESAIIALQGGEFNQEFEPDEVQQWVDTAMGAAKRRLEEQNALNERAEREAKEAQKKLEDETEKKLWTLRADRNLTPALVKNNFRNLDPSAYKRLLDAATGREEPQTNVVLYNELRQKAGRGIDIRGEVTRAANNGLLNQSAIDKLHSEMEQNSPQAYISNNYKRGRDQILTRLKAPDVGPLAPFQKDILGKQLDAWATWSRENPTATPQEAQREFEALIKEGQLINRETLVVAQRKPRFLVGSQEAPNLEETKRKTVEAFRRGEITKRELERQAEIIRDWMRAFGGEQVTEKPSATPR